MAGSIDLTGVTIISAADLTTVLTTDNPVSVTVVFALDATYDIPIAADITGTLSRRFRQMLTNLRFRYQDDTESSGALARACSWFAQYLQLHTLPVSNPLAIGDFAYIADADSLRHNVLAAIIRDVDESAILKFYDLQPGQDGDNNPTFEIVEVTLTTDEITSCLLARF